MGERTTFPKKGDQDTFNPLNNRVKENKTVKTSKPGWRKELI